MIICYHDDSNDYFSTHINSHIRSRIIKLNIKSDLKVFELPLIVGILRLILSKTKRFLDFLFLKEQKTGFSTQVDQNIFFESEIMPPVCPDLSPTQIAKERMGLIETFQCIICIQTAKSTHLCPKVSPGSWFLWCIIIQVLYYFLVLLSFLWQMCHNMVKIKRLLPTLQSGHDRWWFSSSQLAGWFSTPV